MRIVTAFLKDRPRVTALVLLALVGLHWAGARTWGVLGRIPARMIAADDVWTLYLGEAGVVAVLAGFAGVIVIFALSSPSPSFSRMRARGGDSMAANWISPIANSMLAALGSGVCAVLARSGHRAIGWWIFEALLLLSIEAAVRLLWMFANLIQVVAADDRREQTKSDRPRTLAEMQSSARSRASE